MAKQDENDKLVDEATKLLVDIAMGGGVLTADQAIRAQEFITRSYQRNQTRCTLPQAAA